MVLYGKTRLKWRITRASPMTSWKPPYPPEPIRSQPCPGGFHGDFAVGMIVFMVSTGDHQWLEVISENIVWYPQFIIDEMKKQPSNWYINSRYGMNIQKTHILQSNLIGCITGKGTEELPNSSMLSQAKLLHRRQTIRPWRPRASLGEID